MTRLAIEGGRPVRDSFLPYGRHCIGEADIRSVVEVLRSSWLTTGPAVERFERVITERVGAKYAVAVNSGTAALHAAAFAAGVSEGDDVIVPALTFAASANCALYLKAKPVFADILPLTLNMDPSDLERKITSKTKAIVAVDYAGQPCDHDPIRAIAGKHGITVVDDAAHALGATYKGRRTGTIHELTTFSFHPVKHVTTGEGGAVVTDDDLMAAKMRAFRNHGISIDSNSRAGTGSWFYAMDSLGYNYRISDLNCALGISQMENLDVWISRRKRIAAMYTEALSQLSAIRLQKIQQGAESAWHLFVILLDLEKLRVSRNEVFTALRAENIGVNVHYIPVYWHPYYESIGYVRGACPIAENTFERMLTLPLFPSMNDSDVYDVVAACEKVIKAYTR